jgi:hypothetical protein
VELFLPRPVSIDPNTELIVSGGVVIHVKSRQGVDPYFNIPMPKLMKGWHKQWFYLRNDANAPLPVFTGNRPTPHHNWGYRVAKKDLDKL